MKIEHPAAFHFILQDDIYLLNRDKATIRAVSCQPMPVVETKPAGFRYLGGNKKNFLVIVHYHDAEHITDNHLEVLQNIFKRLGYDLGDIAIINRMTRAEANLSELMAYFNPQKLLMLGEDAMPAGAGSLSLNTISRIGDCNSLRSYSFAEMMDDQEKKKAFWEKMKPL